MSYNVRDFLSRVLSWPGYDLPGFCNMHIMMTSKDGKPIWTGFPTTDVDTFLTRMNEANNWLSPTDIYMCMSRQGKTKPPKENGKINPAKSRSEALALKSIYLDIDVKEKSYPTIEDAIKALMDFCKVNNITTPTALVGSGGGLHAHWISDKPLTVEEWQPYATGLKAAAVGYFAGKIDAGVTGDCARILRVPGTFNRKEPVPRAVKLLLLKDNDLDFEKEFSGLFELAPVRHTTKTSVFFDDGVFKQGSMPAVFGGLNPLESLSAGIETKDNPPVKIDNIAHECGFIKEALITGGKEFSQGLWNLSTLASTFMENGHVLAHKMAKGHPDYDHASTEALWERKLKEREDIGLGWPSCAAIKGEGCNHCGSCKYLERSKSPLALAVLAPRDEKANVSIVSAVGPSGQVPVIYQPLVDADLPRGYAIQNGKICKNVSVKDTTQSGVTSEEYHALFHCEVFNPWAQKGPDALNFTVSTDLGFYRDVCIKLSDMGPVDVHRELLRQGVKTYTDNKKYIEAFMVSWIAKLHAEAASRAPMPFGWCIEEGKLEGFSYGGVLYQPNGLKIPTGSIDPELLKIYSPCGELKPWLEACKMITDQHRPGISMLVASAFGAPLMKFVGEYSSILAVFGEGGGGKSTAQRIGAAVWGNPKLAKKSTSSTFKSVLHEMGQTRNLPMYWDEIKDEQAQEQAHGVLWMCTLGVEGSRLKSNITQNSRGDWQNMVIITSNPCFGDFVVKKNNSTYAGLSRLFEYEEKPIDLVNLVGPKMTSLEASMKHAPLDDNYGIMGREYAKFLATNYEIAKQTTHDYVNGFIVDYGMPSHERYWAATCGAILAGAALANQLECEFDLDEMRQFMAEKIGWNRARTGEQTVGGETPEYTEEMLTHFLKEHFRNTLRTEIISPKKMGVPAMVNVISAPLPGCPVHVQWAVKEHKLLISRVALYQWLRRPEINCSPTILRNGLKTHLNATLVRGKVGTGTAFRSGEEMMFTIPVIPGTALFEVMSDPNSQEEATGEVSCLVA